MRITLKAICPEILGALPNGEYEVPDGCDAKSALLRCIEHYGGADVRADCVDHVVYMCGGRRIAPDHVLRENDRLMVLRPLYGG